MKNFALISILGTAASTTAFAPANRAQTPRRAEIPPIRFSGASDADVLDASRSNSAAERYSGAGTAAVDMNAYNLPLDSAVEEWTAELTPGSALMEEGVYLGARSKRDVFDDTLSFEIQRWGGMGIELLEIAGGREDGLGITVASNLVKGGNAEGSGILPGDSIVKLSVSGSVSSPSSVSGSSALEEVEEEVMISTECLGYDATVDAILSLPAPEREDETIIVTVKRLRRKPKVTVKLQYPPSQGDPDSTIELFAGENLRRAMLTRGVKLNDRLSQRFDSGGMGDCGAEGTCATCVVGITKGMELLSPIKIQEKQILEKNPRWRMACKTVVGFGMKEGDMTIQVNPRQWNN